MHPSDDYARQMFGWVLRHPEDFDLIIEQCNRHSIGARSRFYDLVDEYTRPL